MASESLRPQTPPDSIPEEWVRELAAAGALCEKCGGLHIVSMDQLVIALHAHKTPRVTVPWCTCAEECPTCAPFLTKVGPAIAALQRDHEEKRAR